MVERQQIVDPSWVIEPAPGARLIHVNATAMGGGVAELLSGLVRAQHRAGINAGWAVVGGDDDFYGVTKYLHHLLHENATPERLADPALMQTYRRTLAPQIPWFQSVLGPDDVIVLHDPQTLGLAPGLVATGARVVWHCHIGTDRDSRAGRQAVWRAFAPELACLDAVVTTLAGSVPEGTDPGRAFLAPPAIDPLAPKNTPLTRAEVDEVLAGIGLTAAEGVSRFARIVQREVVPPGARVVAQVSRWDPLKDMPGVVRLIEGLADDVHLVLVGTDPTEIPDDPEGLAVFAEVLALVEGMAERDRRRVHLVTTSMNAPNGGAAIVNAIQTRADVVLQKSLEEGFGLSVTEAMFKGTAVIATAVGGLCLQIVDGENGRLTDPLDDGTTRAALVHLLDDPVLTERLGAAGRRSVQADYTMARLVDDYRRICAPRLTSLEAIR